MLTIKDVVEYSKGSKYLHWVIACLVLSMLSLSFFLDDLQTNIKRTGVMVHKSLGLTIFLLMLIRLYWLYHTGRPPLPKSMPRWELLLARGVQYSMYVLLIAMPLSGWIMSTLSDHVPVFWGVFSLPFPGLVPNPDLAQWFFQAHQIIAWLLIGLISLHILGAAKHAFIDRDHILQSMVP